MIKYIIQVFNMKILKRNQIIISVLALMLITAGYMSYTSNFKNTIETGVLMDAEKMAGIGDAKLVNSNNIVGDKNEQYEESEENENSEKSSNNEEVKIETAQSSINSESENDAKQTSNITYGTAYFATSKLERDKMYSQMLETYKSLAENNLTSAEQKNASTNEITRLNNQKSAIMIAENLIKNLGFEDVVIFVNDNSTSVIIKADNLSEADIAKIQNIICREIGVKVENIHISLK